MRRPYQKRKKREVAETEDHEEEHYELSRLKKYSGILIAGIFWVVLWSVFLILDIYDWFRFKK